MQASIFYRTGTYSKEYDSAGNIDSIRGIFPTSAGSIGEGIISRYACVNFGGDNIILSRNGIFGIVLAENVATTERYARERSRSINEKLTRHENLSEAVGIVYKNRYYLSLDDVCYIADSRFKYTSEDDIDGSYNYEWWYWTNIPVRVWAVVDNELCFGTRDGQVCVFDNEYTDRTHQTSQPGDLSLDLLNNRITYNSHIRVDLAENDIITFSTSGIYALALRDFTVKGNKIYVTEEEIVNLTEGTEVYADNVEGSGLSLNTKYLFHEIDKGACCFGLIDDEGNEVEITGEGFRLCKYISQKTLYLSNITESTFQLKEYKSGEVLTLTNYNGTLPTSITASVLTNATDSIGYDGVILNNSLAVVDIHIKVDFASTYAQTMLYELTDGYWDNGLREPTTLIFDSRLPERFWMYRVLATYFMYLSSNNPGDSTEEQPFLDFDLKVLLYDHERGELYSFFQYFTKGIENIEPIAQDDYKQYLDVERIYIVGNS